MPTKVRQVDYSSDCLKVIREAAKCLADGKLVVFPTETVYGVGANAVHPEALVRLREVKGRQETRPFTVHIGSRAAVHRFVPRVEGMAHRLIQKAWPGPLTLIFPVDQPDAAPVIRETSKAHIPALYHEGTIGIRYPDDSLACDLFSRAGVPVVAASANPAGAPAPVDARQAIQMLDGQVDLVLDAGRTRYGKPSTIVRVESGEYTILREGILDARTISRLAKTNVLFVCTGNTCRSAMAEGLLRHLWAKHLGCKEADLEDRGYHIESAGVDAWGGAPASWMAAGVLENRGIDLSGHRSSPLSLDVLRRADYIFTMTAGHRRAVLDLLPEAQDRCRLLDGPKDIEDPIGGDEACYNLCAERIERALKRCLKEILL